MTMTGLTRIRDLFQPEELDWRGQTRAVNDPGSRGLSLKAVFWCAAAIALSLALGNLT